VRWLAPDAVIMTISGTAARAAKLTQDLNVSSSILSSMARYSGPPVQPAATRPLLTATVVTSAGLPRSGPPRPLSQPGPSLVRRRPEIDGPVSRTLPGPATLGRGGFIPPSTAGVCLSWRCGRGSGEPRCHQLAGLADHRLGVLRGAAVRAALRALSWTVGVGMLVLSTPRPLVYLSGHSSPPCRQGADDSRAAPEVLAVARPQQRVSLTFGEERFAASGAADFSTPAWVG